MSWALLKDIHVTCAVLSIAGFFLRGLWMATDNSLRTTRLAKTLPHLIDSLLLGSAIAMLVTWGVWPWEQPWLMAKITALLAYIVLGMVALRFGRTRRVRLCAWLAALATSGYIVAVALTRDPMGYLALL